MPPRRGQKPAHSGVAIPLVDGRAMGERDLTGRAVAVEARRLADRVIAVVQPVGPWRVTPKRERAEGPSLFSE